MNKHFKNWYFPALVAKKEMPPIEKLKKMADEDKDKANEVVQDAYKILKDLKEEDLKKFNEMWKKVLDEVKVLGGVAKKLDESLTAYADAYKGEFKESNEYAMGPVTERKQLYKVFESLQAFKVSAKKAADEADDYQQDKKNEEKVKSNIGVILLVLVLLAGCCAVGVCKWQGMCCFKEEKEDMQQEGGEPVKSDRKIFKKEVKSKNSHKRHVKESLVPAFKVAEDEA